MKKFVPAILFCLLCPLLFRGNDIRFDFYGQTIEFQLPSSSFVDFNGPLSAEAVNRFRASMDAANYRPVMAALEQYRQNMQPSDWLFYQLIRKTAQQISPKADNYDRYTLYKWYLLVQSGYDAMLCIAADKMLFYVQSDENIYNIPSRISNGRQYICLNYHDYGNIDFNRYRFEEVAVNSMPSRKGFSYRVTQLPEFRPEDYKEKEIRFTYYNNEYRFKVKLNPQVQAIFANYPVVDYGYYFNIPLSKETYASLIPSLKKNVKGLSPKNGIDYLMHFTRNAFAFEKDSEGFGKEKRMSPEETLLYDRSDCEDRAALFFYLVKEIYDLPMIVLVYPTHVTVAVHFDKAAGEPIVYNGNKYYVCEPTPQAEDLKVGERLKSLSKAPFEVAYAYTPGKK
jgi:hypothetical protein